MEKIETEYNLVLEDYLAVEEYAYFTGINSDYSVFKKNSLVGIYLFGLTGFVLCTYFLSGMIVVIMALFLVLLVVLYRKYADYWTWRRLRSQLKKHITNFQFKGDPQGMNSCKLRGDLSSFCVWTKDENQVFHQENLRSVSVTNDYFFLYDDRGRGIGIPLKRVKETDRAYLEKWANNWG